MTELQKALENLRPKDFSDVPHDDLKGFLSNIFSNAELIANSVPEAPGGTPFEQSKRSHADPNGATSLNDLTISKARRPPPSKEQAEIQKAWGKPVKLSAKDTALGISVFKMAGHDRHGAWFARTSVHEGLGFTKWKKAMMREFPESLEVQGGPGEGNVRGIGGDKRLEDIVVEGVGKMEVYQLSAQFPGPVAPREFITLLLTSENALSESSKIDQTVPRHYMVVSIPVTHPDAPPRNGLVRGFYESVEMIREIPLPSTRTAAASTSDLLEKSPPRSRDRGSTIGFAESRGAEAKGEKIDKQDDADEHDPETNPVEWLMVTRSDPGGGIPRFMVERNTPSSIVQDAGKFLNWACNKDEFPDQEENEEVAQISSRRSLEDERFTISDSNGILAGVGTSIADKPVPHTFRRASHQTVDENQPGILGSVANAVEGYLPESLKPLQRTDSQSSSTTSTSSLDSWASAEQFNTAPEGLAGDMPSPSSQSGTSIPISLTDSHNGHMSRELNKIEQKRIQLKEKLEAAREKQTKETQDAGSKSAKDLEKATEKHNRERKKQEDKFAKEVQKLEQRRERETRKLLMRQQKEADKNTLLKMQRERDEWKQKAELSEQENKLLKDQIGGLQKENTALVARLGKTDLGRELLKNVKEDLDFKGSGKGRTRADSRASADSRGSKASAGKKNDSP